MSSQLSENRSSLPAAVLAACVLGLVLCAVVYLAIVSYLFSTPGLVESVFWFLLLLPLICSSYLLYRFLSRPKEQPLSRVQLIADSFSLLAVTVFIIIASIIWWTPVARVGMSLIIFLVASLLSLPVVLIRKTALQQRLMRLPNSILTLVLVLIVSISVGILVVFHMSPPQPAFIGGPKRAAVSQELPLGNLINRDSPDISLRVEKGAGSVYVLNVGQSPIAIRSVLFNNKPDCDVNNPPILYPPVELQISQGRAFFSQCEVIDFKVETDRGVATFKFDR